MSDATSQTQASNIAIHSAQSLVGKPLRFRYVKPSLELEDGENAPIYTMVNVDRADEFRFSGRVMERNGNIRHFRMDRVVSIETITPYMKNKIENYIQNLEA